MSNSNICIQQTATPVAFGNITMGGTTSSFPRLAISAPVTRGSSTLVVTTGNDKDKLSSVFSSLFSVFCLLLLLTSFYLLLVFLLIISEQGLLELLVVLFFLGLNNESTPHHNLHFHVYCWNSDRQ